MGRQSRRQTGGGIVGQFRRRAVDDDDERVLVLRKEAVHLGLGLAPRQVRIDEMVGAGIDAPVRGVVPAEQDRQHQADGDDRMGVAARELDDLLRHGGDAWRDGFLRRLAMRLTLVGELFAGHPALSGFLAGATPCRPGGL